MNTTTTETIYTTQTSHGELKYYHDWSCDGAIRMINPKTIKHYEELKDTHPDCDKCGVFFAFTNEGFDRGYRRLVELGHIKDGDKVVRSGSLFGSQEGLREFYGFYNERNQKIIEECDPQEVYFYEYNNHECMYSWEGDKEALDVIREYWGDETAEQIDRV